MWEAIKNWVLKCHILSMLTSRCVASAVTQRSHLWSSQSYTHTHTHTVYMCVCVCVRFINASPAAWRECLPMERMGWLVGWYIRRRGHRIIIKLLMDAINARDVRYFCWTCLHWGKEIKNMTVNLQTETICIIFFFIGDWMILTKENLYVTRNMNEISSSIRPRRPKKIQSLSRHSNIILVEQTERQVKTDSNKVQFILFHETLKRRTIFVKF